MKKTAFTLMEVLIAMSIIGIIAAATANSIKNMSVNKAQQVFKNCYNHVVQTVSAITSDEDFYPDVVSNLTNYDSTGHAKRDSMCLMGLNFPLQFKNASKSIKDGEAVSNGYAFETSGGTYWLVKQQTSSSSCQTTNLNNSTNADYIIMFDTDGPYEGSNCPYNILNPSSTPSGCPKPDTFLFGVNANNEVIADTTTSIYNGLNLSDFIKILK
ncbi:prepilin-type N-terminal cleavage/methylation domain-containing protein [bacterium]|nr:prepilin-type N-terminal cleavage/methylation domain-containing protein [bacterium]